MKIPGFSTVGFSILCFMAVYTTPAFSSSDSLTVVMAAYFERLRLDFEKCAAAPLVESSRKRQIQIYFKSTLKKHRSMVMLMKTDATGIATNQASIDKRQRLKNKIISKRPWFSRVIQNQKGYDCLVKETDGRYYLYWSVAILRKKASSYRRFNGVFVAKIDPVRCFKAIASTGVQPFSIRINDTDCYSHKWDSKMIFVEDILSIPGAENISVRYQKSMVSTMESSETKRTDTVSAAGMLRKTSSDSATVKKVKKSSMPIVVSMVILSIVLAVFIFIIMRDRARNNSQEQQL